MTSGCVKALCWVSVASGFCGCGSTLKQRELEQVAKDWALTIRASQVIPVYPLTEDLQPGDVFLVTRPIQEQQKEYERRGFLPLDQHLTRLEGLDFQGMYGKSFGVADHPNTPHHWQFPPDGQPVEELAKVARKKGRSAGGGATAAPPKADADVSHASDHAATPAVPAPAASPAPEVGAAGVQPGGPAKVERLEKIGDKAEHDENEERAKSPSLWHLAPRAGFPTYTFQVRSGVGAAVAIPIQGVPVGLSVLQSDKATGTVTIADAHTYAVPFDKIVDKVQRWAALPRNRRILQQVHAAVQGGESWYHRMGRFFAGDDPPTIYLRVVHRVYLAERVVVQLTNDEEFAGKGTGGEEKNVDFPALTSGETTQNYLNALGKLSEAVDATVPGGTIELAYATRRSVSMSETFDRPLVIGFLGFDFPVLDHGELGAPIATLHQGETGKLMPLPAPVVSLDTPKSRGALLLLYKSLNEKKGELGDPAVLDKVSEMAKNALPQTYPVPIVVAGPDAKKPIKRHSAGDAFSSRDPFENLVIYYGELLKSEDAIEAAKDGGAPTLEEKPIAEILERATAERERVAKALDGPLVTSLLETLR